MIRVPKSGGKDKQISVEFGVLIGRAKPESATLVQLSAPRVTVSTQWLLHTRTAMWQDTG